MQVLSASYSVAWTTPQVSGSGSSKTYEIEVNADNIYNADQAPGDEIDQSMHSPAKN